MRFLGVLFCFALSGFAALLYETAWMREFSFVFGTSELAVVSVLAAYMGGLAAGAAAASRFAPRVRRPVLVYGLFELGIALCALAVPRAIHGTTRLYVRLFGGLPSLPDEGQLGGALFHLAASFAILLVPTALMGATLPLLARHAVRREEEIARRVGVLYTANTAGAVAGTLVAAFALLPALGLRHTVYVGAAVNALVFALAAALALRAPPVAMAPSRQDLRPEGPAWILPLLAVSGAVSFTYEVLWTRLLGHVLGGSVYAFATMLASFLAGIALGSAVAARVARTPGRASAGFAVAQLGAAALSLLAFFAVDRIADLAGALGAGARGSPPVNALFAAVALLPPAFCVGATFPCAVRLLARSEHQAAAASARAYAWNTVGAIAGAVLAGFVLLPALGYAHTLAAAAAANLLVAMLCALPSARLAPVTALAATGLAALVLLPPPTPWRLLRSSPWSPSDADGEVVYAAVGRSATVLLTEWETGWELRTNGLAEANIEGPGERPGRYRKVWWLSALPVLARPEAHTMLVVGLGGGLVVEAVPRAVRDVAVVELEPEVVNANRAIGALRRDDPLADPRVRLHVNDARGGLLLTDERFDAVVSQPSHPWVSGASHLYTREFFALVRDHLAPGGVFSQWMGLAYVDADLLRSLVATLYDVFAHVEVYVLDDHAILLASDAPLVTPDSIRAAVAAEPEHFARIGVVGPEDVLAERLFDAEAARRFAEGAPVTSDDDNLFATRSPRVLARALGREGGEALFAERSSLLTDGDAATWCATSCARRVRAAPLRWRSTSPARSTARWRSRCSISGARARTAGSGGWSARSASIPATPRRAPRSCARGARGRAPTRRCPSSCSRPPTTPRPPSSRAGASSSPATTRACVRSTRASRASPSRSPSSPRR